MPYSGATGQCLLQFGSGNLWLLRGPLSEATSGGDAHTFGNFLQSLC